MSDTSVTEAESRYWYTEFLLYSELFYPNEHHKADGIPGVYALWSGMKIVYIGKSKSSIGERIRYHMRDKFKSFTAFSWLDFDLAEPEIDLGSIERDAIRELDPIYNLRMSGYDVAQLALIGKLYLLDLEKSRRSNEAPEPNS